jgi:DNA adenine methylase
MTNVIPLLKEPPVTRPAMRYHGGKWRIAPWIIENFAAHRIYVEPYGGGASVLLRKPRCYAEVYNDLDSEVVNVFKVFRDHGQELKKALWATPFGREEFVNSYFQSSDPIEQARRTIARSFMGFGSASVTKTRHTTTRFCKPTTGFRANSNRSGTVPAHDWANYADAAEALIIRMRGVTIENKDALEVMLHNDRIDVLHYVDPPYVAASRDAGSDYKYEMTDDCHRRLADVLKSLKGKVCLSGYPSSIYEELYHDWRRVERKALADGAKERTEVLWMNYDSDMLKLI